MTTVGEQEKKWQGKHLIKLRDYKEPTELKDPNTEELRSIVEPWLTALFQSEHLSLLTGAGISSAVHYLATGDSGAGMGNMKITEFKDQINKKSIESAEKSGRGEANIEDEIRTINELIRGLEIELPSLPSQKAILLGWASELPILVNIRSLKSEQQPQSADPDFWDVWTRKDKNGEEVTRNVNCKTISDDWQEKDIN